MSLFGGVRRFCFFGSLRAISYKSKLMKLTILVFFLLCCFGAVCSADPPANTPPAAPPSAVSPAAPITPTVPITGGWEGVLGGPGNHLRIRIGGDSSRLTATTDSIDQGLIALPTGATIDADNNVAIKIGEQPPLTFNGVLKGNTIIGIWAEDTHSGPMTLTRNDDLSNAPNNAPIPRLSGSWIGVRSGIAFHYVFHISGSRGVYTATADSPDQNAMGMDAAAKIDSMNNVFLAIGFQRVFYFTGIVDGNKIVGTWSQGVGMGEMSFSRER